MLRQGDTGDWIGTFEGHKGAVWSSTLNKDATKAATGAADFFAKIWDANSGDEIKSLEHGHIVKSVEFSHTGTHLLTGSNEKLLRIFDLNAPDSEPIKFKGHTSSIKTAIYTPDDKKVISASDDKTVRVWDATNGEEIKTITLPCAPADLELSKDGAVLTVPYGKNVAFYDLNTFERLNEFEFPTQINAASLHPDKSVFVCGGENFLMYKHDYATGMEIESFKGHFGPIHCIRFSPDGELYSSGSEDGTLRLWQTTVGKTYGLWKYVVPEEQSSAPVENGTAAPAAVKVESWLKEDVDR